MRKIFLFFMVWESIKLSQPLKINLKSYLPKVNFLVCVSMLLLTVGCQDTKTKAVEGAVVGGVLGAAAGGIIGHQTHHGGEGAAIGAAVGALGGGLIGGQMEKQPQSSQTSTSAPVSQVNQMAIQDVVDLAKQGATDAVIVDKIRVTSSKFNLTTDDINYLKKEGVSQKVINVMQGKPR